jgi:hypothetical protein
MKLIMDSSKMAHVNTTNMVSKANMAFAAHFVEQLSMALYFNDFEKHSCPQKEYTLSTPDNIASGIGHNQKILLYYLSSINKSCFSKLFPKGYNKSLETQVHKVVHAQFDLVRKMKDPRNGIIMTFPSKVDKPHGMWIHRFFLLQNICSEIAVKDEAAIGAYSFFGNFGNADVTWKSFMTVVKGGNNDGHRDNLVSILAWKA